MARSAAELLAMLHARGVLWHRPRGRKKWRRVATFPSVGDAIEELFKRERAGEPGSFFAGVEGLHPDDDRDEE